MGLHFCPVSDHPNISGAKTVEARTWIWTASRHIATLCEEPVPKVPADATIPACGLDVLQSFQQPSKRGAKNFLAVVLDDGTVSNNDLIEVPIKYPLHRRAHAPTIGNGEPIKTGESATGKRADNQRAHYPCDPRILLA